MREAAGSRGVPIVDDMNGQSNEGASFPNLNAVNGVRWSVSRGYLRPVIGRPNLTVLTNSLVTKLGFEAGRCVSVTHLIDGAPQMTRAAREVVLCAGAIDTPRLLLMSGIGDAAELKRLGVPIVAHLGGVGQNLQDHPLLMGINFAAREPLPPPRDNGGGCIVNWRSSAGEAAPDLHAFFVHGPHAGPIISREYVFPRDCFAISPGLMRSKSSGYLRLESALPGGRVEIQPNLLRESSDVQALAEAIEFCMDLAMAPPLAPFVAGLIAPNRRLSRAEREMFVRQSCDTFFHTCGTCAMGTDDSAVVDPLLRVRGVDGLRIADASVIPVIPSCNTNAPVVMIAERAADFVLGSHEIVKEPAYAPAE
jgi:choline dehydrogenase